jgi:PHP family Zn ribbon phosphoesterase
VDALADRDPNTVVGAKVPYKSIVPLAEVLAEAFGVSSTASKKVFEEYMRLTDRVANEFALLLETPLEVIAKEATDPRVVEAIKRMREGRLHIQPGYDGVYGTVKIFSDGDRPAASTQASFF